MIQDTVTPSDALAHDPVDDLRPPANAPAPVASATAKAAGHPLSPAQGATVDAAVSEQASDDAREAANPALPLTVDVRSLSLALLAVLASLFVLHWAKQIFIPVMLGLLLSYALSPVVNWLQPYRVPRSLSAGLLLLALTAGIGSAGYALRDDANDLLESLPVAAQKVRQALRERQAANNTSALEKVQKAASQIEQAAAESGTSAAPARGVTRVVIERPRFNITDYLWTGTVGLLTLLAQATMVMFLTFFLMASGDTFRRKLVKLAGPTLSSKKITVQALDEINLQIQRYLQVQLLCSVLVGVLTWLALEWIGLEHAAVWGIAAGVTNMIPYVGSLLIVGATSLVGFLQFGNLEMTLLVAGASVLIHTVIGNLLTPWLTSRAGRMNPVAVFIGLLAWGWLWGMWGLLLGIPILMVIKTVCDRVEDLKPVGEFLGS